MEPLTTNRGTGPGARTGARRETGFSLVEVLIAAVILLAVVLALLPLMALSLSNNVAGREYSVASQHSRSRVEEYSQIPLDRPELTVPAGEAESVLDEVLGADGGGFTTGAVDQPRWTRVTTVRQYSVRDLYDNGRLVDALPGGSPPNHVHLREVIVEVESEREPGATGGGREVAITTVRGF